MYICRVYRKGTSIRQVPEFISQSIKEKPMEYHLDEWFEMTPYVAGLLHPAIFS